MNHVSPIRYIKTMSWNKYRQEIRKYLFLLFIPSLIMLVLYSGVRQIVSSQIKKQADLISSQFFTRVSKDFQDTEKIADLISSGEVFQNFLLCNENELTKNYLETSQWFSSLVNVNSSIGHIYLVRLSDNKISSDTGLITSVSLPAILRQTGISEQEYKNASKEPAFTLLNATRRQPSGICRIYDAQNKTAVGTLIITFDLEYLHSIFSSVDTAVCTLFNENVAITSYNKMINPSLFNGHFDWLDKKHVEKLVGEPVTCIYKTHEDYTFLVALLNREYYQPLNLITYSFVILILTDLVIGYLYLYRISKKRYDNIQKMAEALPSQYKGDVMYEDIYKTICNTLMDFQSQRERIDAQNKEAALKHILQTDDPAFITNEILQQAKLEPSANAYTVINYFVDKISDTRLRQTHGADLRDYLSMFIYTTIKELLDPTIFHLFFCADQNIYTAVICSGETAEYTDQIFNIAQQSNEIICGTYHLTLYTVVSKTLGTIQSLPAAYQETLDLHRFAVSIDSPVHTLNSLITKHRSRSVLSGDFIRQRQTLLNAIMAKKYAIIPSMAEALLSTHVVSLHDNIKLASNRLDAIRFDLIEGIRMAALENFDTARATESLRLAQSAQTLVDSATDIYNELDRLSSQTKTLDYVRIATRYIEENLSDQNLNVALICEASGISVQRLTRMFQEKYRMPVGDYMNTCRIEKAKSLLTHTNLTVSQIAQDVGFTNVNTLTRNFKKREGITPTDYRNFSLSK